MLPGLELLHCPGLAVPATVMRHIVDVESGANPYAIGVVGGRLERQPRNLDEAVATARMLEARGYNFSLGLAQVNRSNLRKYGLDTHEKAFDACANLSAASRILAGCYSSAGGEWGKAFSCYYSGDFTTGFRRGYVQKVYDSIAQGSAGASDRQARPAAAAIPLRTDAAVPARQPRVFVPRVRGPNDPVAMKATPVSQPARTTPAAPAAPPSPGDQADLRQGSGDTAFVF